MITGIFFSLFKKFFWYFPDLFFLNKIFKPFTNFGKVRESIDYSNPKYWFVFPNQNDESFNRDDNVDLFYVHRTTFFSKIQWNDLNAHHKSCKRALNYSVKPIIKMFSGICSRIYIPKYRQANLYSYFEKNQNSQRALDLAYDDIKKSFIIFLNNTAKDKSKIVLAGHSQGAHHISRLLKDFFDDDDALRKRLVIAYVIGWPIDKNLLENIKTSETKDDLHCYVSWCTFGEMGFPSYFNDKFKRTICTNPLSWSITKSEINKTHHQGGLSYDLKKIHPKLISVKIDKNVLQISKPNKFGFPCIPKRDFVIVDFHLFYENIRNNLKHRLLRMSLMNSGSELR